MRSWRPTTSARSRSGPRSTRRGLQLIGAIKAEHGPAALRARDARRSAQAPLELLLPRTRQGAARSSSASRCARSRWIAERPASTRSTSPSWTSPSGSSTTRRRSTTPTSSGSATSASRTRRSWTSSSPPPRAASSRRRPTRWASCLTQATRELEPELREVLVVGRPIADT